VLCWLCSLAVSIASTYAASAKNREPGDAPGDDVLALDPSMLRDSIAGDAIMAGGEIAFNRLYGW